MENFDDRIGTVVSWNIKDNVCLGLFLSIQGDKVEVVCYQAGATNCHLKMLVDINIVKFSNQ
jgi:hypothetical protein